MNLKLLKEKINKLEQLDKEVILNFEDIISDEDFDKAIEEYKKTLDEAVPLIKEVIPDYDEKQARILLVTEREKLMNILSVL